MRIQLTSVRTMALAFGLVLAAASIAGAQQGGGAPAQAPPSMAGKTAEQFYKNIQILSGTPADQVIPSMRLINHALGVECTFCHVQGDFTKDDKDTKKTAREMMTMMFAINKTNFNGRTAVTCYTCHNGHNDPTNVPPVGDITSMTARPATPEPPAASSLPSADQIVAKYLDALGGEPALRKITSRTITAMFDRSAPEGGQPGAPVHGQAEQYQKAPNLSMMVLHLPNNTAVTTGFDGTTAWAQDARGNVTEASTPEQARFKREADFYWPLNFKQLYARMAVRGTEKVGDRDAYVVLGFPQGAPADRLDFDTQTGLLLRKMSAKVTPLGNHPEETDYQDYRDAGGVKFPYTILMADPSDNPERTIVHVQKIENNTSLDNGKFAKPAPKSAGN